jgi:hypothetical protein
MPKRILALGVFAILIGLAPTAVTATQKGTSQQSVFQACNRTNGCFYSCTKEGCAGCSPTVCFRCVAKICYPVRSSGKPIPGGGSLGSILKNAPPGPASTNVGRVNEAPTQNTNPVAGRVGGRH